MESGYLSLSLVLDEGGGTVYVTKIVYCKSEITVD